MVLLILTKLLLSTQVLVLAIWNLIPVSVLLTLPLHILHLILTLTTVILIPLPEIPTILHNVTLTTHLLVILTIPLPLPVTLVTYVILVITVIFVTLVILVIFVIFVIPEILEIFVIHVIQGIFVTRVIPVILGTLVTPVMPVTLEILVILINTLPLVVHHLTVLLPIPEIYQHSTQCFHPFIRSLPMLLVMPPFLLFLDYLTKKDVKVAVPLLLATLHHLLLLHPHPLTIIPLHLNSLVLVVLLDPVFLLSILTLPLLLALLPPPQQQQPLHTQQLIFPPLVPLKRNSLLTIQ